MDMRHDHQALRNQFFHALVESVVLLKAGPDPELALEMLIEAAGMLKEHLERELDELRLEQVE